MTSRSIVWQSEFPDNDMFHAMIASALKKLLDKQVRFEEEQVSKSNVLKKTTDSYEIAYMNCEHFSCNRCL